MTATMRASGIPHPARRWLTAGLAASLAVAGIIHCALIPDHFVRSTLFGLGFVGAGIAQLGLSGAVLLRPGRLVYAAIIATSLTFMSLYAFNVLVGLPFHGSPDRGAVVAAHDEGGAHGEASSHELTGERAENAAVDGHGEGGLILGAGEPVDALGAGTGLAELAAIVLAVLLLRGAPSGARTVVGRSAA